MVRRMCDFHVRRSELVIPWWAFIAALLVVGMFGLALGQGSV